LFNFWLIKKALINMINPRLLKISACVNSLLNEPKSSALDVDVKRLQGPNSSNSHNSSSKSLGSAAISKDIFINGKIVKFQTKKDESGEYVIILE